MMDSAMHVFLETDRLVLRRFTTSDADNLAELDADPRDPAQNAEAGARYLRDLLEKYENDPHQVSKAVAAYNAGPAAVDKYHGIPPYPETIQYVNRVLKQYEKEQAQVPAKQKAASGD